jgi:hypothetical protein
MPTGPPSGIGRAWLLLGLVAVGLSAGGVGAGGVGAARAQTGNPGSSSIASAVLARPKATAKADAARQLAEARLPKSARKVHGDQSIGGKLGPATVLRGPFPACRHLVYDSSYWRAPGGSRALLTWFKAHVPRDAKLSFWGHGSWGLYVVGYVFPDQQNVAFRWLKMSLAAAKGGGSAIRADGLAVWRRPHGRYPCASAGRQR